MTDPSLKPIAAAVLRLLRPLVRILLTHGISYKTFSDLAKWVYVDVARRDFRISGRKQSTSRISVVTGLSRKEVARVRKILAPDDSGAQERYNRAARVISAWQREIDFTDDDDNPLPLPLTGTGATFSELVKRFSGDVPARAVADELIRVGAVEKLSDDCLQLLVRAYVPESSKTDKLQILGADVASLIATIDHNLETRPDGPRFQRKVEYDNLPDEALPAFKKLSAAKAQTLLKNLDRWLAERDRDVNPAVEGTGRNRAGLGIYYFEEPFTGKES